MFQEDEQITIEEIGERFTQGISNRRAAIVPLETEVKKFRELEGQLRTTGVQKIEGSSNTRYEVKNTQ